MENENDFIPICINHIEVERIPFYEIITITTYEICYVEGCRNVTNFAKEQNG